MDAGADLDYPSSDGTIPLFYATNLGYDDVAMYLCLRCDDISMQDVDGQTIFTKYMFKKDYGRLT